MILSLARSTLPCVFGLLLLVEAASSQTFDSFRFVGIPGMSTGTVTNLSFESVDVSSAGGTVEIGELSYFDAAGLSTVFTVTATPSSVLNGQTQVFASNNAAAEESLQLAELIDVSFYTAELTHSTHTAPPNWFRLTSYQGVWSGVFRVGDQAYSLSRGNPSTVVDVRTSLSDTVTLNPSLRGKVSAVLNTDYFTSGSIGRPANQLPALESIHVLDGLLSDSLGLTLQLEQIVLANVFDTDTTLTTALNWKAQNQNLFGADDKLATLFFTDQPFDSTTDNSINNTHNATVATDDATIIQPHSVEYQFATAHNFAKLLKLSAHTGTLLDWQQAGLVSLPAVHLNQQQQDEFDNNPPASGLLQALNNDQAANDRELFPEPIQLDSVLVDSDSEERVSLPQNDPITPAAASSGAGAVFWIYLVALIFFRHAVRSFRLAR